MTLTIEQALENIYTSLLNDNADINTHIGHLKTAMAAQGQKTVMVESKRLAQNNRQGRKTMQSYFKKCGVDITFNQE